MSQDAPEHQQNAVDTSKQEMASWHDESVEECGERNVADDQKPNVEEGELERDVERGEDEEERTAVVMSKQHPPAALVTKPPMDQTTTDRCRGCLVGLAVGDAVGTTVEFKRPGSFRPLTDMTGGGPFGLRAGEWTDDTSMALCLGHSLAEQGKFDATDQMNRYCNWYMHGYMSSNGRCFDIGNTVRSALDAYRVTKNPFAGSTDPASAGNGSIMRLAPVAIFYRRDPAEAEYRAAESSRTTHGTAECVDACRMLVHVLMRALDGAPKDEVLAAAAMVSTDISSAALKAIADGSYLGKSAAQIRGTGYVVASLEAALWAFASTDNFRDAILAAANLGDDADTTAAVCGQIAGAYYGLHNIPESWLNKLVKREEIIELADRLSQN